jgi:hypothetical protein
MFDALRVRCRTDRATQTCDAAAVNQTQSLTTCQTGSAEFIAEVFL